MAARAQDRDRFNIGLHYNPPIDNTISTFSGGVDLRVRAVSLGVFNLGGGLSASYRSLDSELIKDFVVFNPQIYVEVQPFDFALKPYFAVGYAFYSEEYNFEQPNYYTPDQYDAAFSNTLDPSVNYSGVTLAAGARFDFARFLFADVGLKYFSLQSDENLNRVLKNKSYGTIHLGFGFRF